jgi:hypothetical protein
MTNAPRKTARVLAREQALAQMADEARGRGSIGFVAKQVRGGIQLIEHLDMYRSKFVQLSLDGEPREETIREWDYRHLPAFRVPKRLTGNRVATRLLFNPWFGESHSLPMSDEYDGTWTANDRFSLPDGPVKVYRISPVDLMISLGHADTLVEYRSMQRKTIPAIETPPLGKYKLHSWEEIYGDTVADLQAGRAKLQGPFDALFRRVQELVEERRSGHFV